MQIKYSTESKYTAVGDLRTGDVFVHDEDAFIILDQERMSITDDMLCARLDNGMIVKFSDDDLILPMPQSILEVKA